MNREIDDKTNQMLDEFSVDFPSEEEIDQAINDLHQYAPKPKRRINLDNLKQLLLLAGREVFYVSPLFWFLNILFLVSGGLITFFNHSNPYWTLFILSPIPFLTGLLEVFKSRNHGLIELEGTCKYSAQQVILSKLLLVGVFNLSVNILLIVMFSVSLDINFTLTALLTYWVMPFTLLSAIGLVITIQFRNAMVSPILTAVWLVSCLVVSHFQLSEDFIKNMSVISNMVVIIMAISLMVYMIRRIKRGTIIDIDRQ
jgi:hypothetical protein